jgi:uncharacterized beta barrel domain-containing protein DUF5777
MPRTPRMLLSTCVLLALAALLSTDAAAQTPDQPPAQQTTPPEIELNLINTPTTLTVRRHKSYFRLTHRFARDLRRGDFGDLAQDLFSLDNGAIIGLEYRFGVTSHLEAGVHRSTLSKTIQFLGRYGAWRQSESMPVSMTFLASLEGLDNMHTHHQPGLGVTVSRAFGSAVVAYASPTWVANTRTADFLSGHEGHDHGGIGEGEEDEHLTHGDYTVYTGLGARVRVRPTVYLTGEVSPRLAGHDPNRATWGAAIEKRTRGHVLQVNFGNSFGTTLGQIARGGSTHDVYLGFNVVRKW